MIVTALVVLIAAAGCVLSLKSALVLGRAAPWTAAGWWLTIAYFIAVVVKSTALPGLPTAAEYTVLGLLTIAFVIAGVRDEAQAEPWWWPSGRGATRAQRRGTSER